MKQVPVFYRIMGVLWPSFLGAGVLSGVIFSLFDPRAAQLPIALAEQNVLGFYTLLFFLLWLVVGLACWLSVALGPSANS